MISERLVVVEEVAEVGMLLAVGGVLRGDPLGDELACDTGVEGNSAPRVRTAKDPDEELPHCDTWVVVVAVLVDEHRRYDNRGDLVA